MTARPRLTPARRLQASLAPAATGSTAWTERLLGIRRHSWTRTQLRRRALARALESLHAGQIDTLLLNDEALGRHYPSIGLRPIGGPTGGVDVLEGIGQVPRFLLRALVRRARRPAPGAARGAISAPVSERSP